MVTDSTELTFVRCPSCRSLVPAVSTRCRMCGTGLGDAASEEEQAQPKRPSGRVRQHTSSTAKQKDLAAARDRIQEDSAQAGVEQDEEEFQEVTDPWEDEGELSADDPLGAYLEEVEVADTFEEEAQEKNGSGEPLPDTEEAAVAKKKAADPLPAIETESAAEEEEWGEEEDQDEDELKPLSKAKKTKRARGSREIPPVPEKEPAPSRTDRTTVPPVKEQKDRQGRLFGWFVSYVDSDGTSIELREGKFFVTSSSLKKSDLIIDDESVSTPHAMVTVSVEKGLLVQDLMSDRGVFVRRKGADTYVREVEAATVENGDWLRFGDVEFLVSLVPYVGEK